MKKSVAITVIAILAVAAIALGVMYITNNDSKTKEIAARDADIADKAVQIETLNADVAGKAGEIEKLTEDVSSRDGQIDTLNKLVDTKNGEIETLNTDVAYKAGQIDTLTADAKDKADQIETLKADVADKASQIEALNADIEDKVSQIDTLTADVKDKADQIEKLNEDVADKAGQIEALNANVADKVSQIETLNADVAYKAGQIDLLSADVADKAEQIEKLKAKAADQFEQILTLTADIVARTDQIEKLKIEIAAGKESTGAAASVMSYEEFMNAEMVSPVYIEAYVQANQSWWDGKIKLYMQDEKHGGYFIYDLPCTEEEAAIISVPGTRLRIKGVKDEWSGEVEIIGEAYEILEGSFIAEPEDVTSLFGKDELIKHMNEKITVKDAKVVAKTIEGQEGEFAFLYAWDGSGSNKSNSDLYFDVEIGGQTYTFTVESYLCGNGTDVYKAVEGLKVGDIIDLEGFLYWYNGAFPHITAVNVLNKGNVPSASQYNIKTIIPVYHIGKTDSVFYHHLVCKCLTDTGDTIYVYMKIDTYKQLFDPTAKVQQKGYLQYEEKQFSNPITITGSFRNADSLDQRIYAAIGVSTVFEIATEE